jgi:hypothetical protein
VNDSNRTVTLFSFQWAVLLHYFFNTLNPLFHSLHHQDLRHRPWNSKEDGQNKERELVGLRDGCCVDLKGSYAWKSVVLIKPLPCLTNDNHVGFWIATKCSLCLCLSLSLDSWLVSSDFNWGLDMGFFVKWFCIIQ